MDDNLNKKIEITNKKSVEIGADTNGDFINTLIDGAQVGMLDISSIDALSQSAQSRERTYELIDSMASDPIISAILETYAEDSVETNDEGETVWIESQDVHVLDFTSWLLSTLEISKHLYQWAHCLITYGDVYVRLYRKSDYEQDLLFSDNKYNKYNKQLNEALDKDIDEKMDSDPLLEDINLKVYGKDDLYIPYVEMVPNPGEIFDLQKFGKTHGFIKAPTNIIQPTTDELYSYLTRYKMKQTDVEIYDAMSFVHAYLDNTTQRKPETVDLFLNKNNNFTTQDGEQVPYSTTSYSVKRGQSILFNSFRGWRQLNLLEMSALLNRITQSAVIRIIQVETSDIPKTQVRPYIQRLKEKIEQKTGLDISEGMTEYNNPSPIINTIYIPTHEGKGVINATTIGGDYDPKSLADIEYYRDRLFGSLKIPKQYFGFTEDGAGFNGGQSLTIISSRYGKSIKMIKKKLCELVTNILNYFLINRGLDSYVNRFSVKMQVPITQEELDRRTNNDNRIRYVSDVMNQLGEVDDKIVKLRIQRELLSTIINNSTVMKLLDGYIEKLETEKKESKPKKSTKDENVEDTNFGTEDNDNLDLASPEELEMEDMLNDDQPILLEKEDENDESSYLPSPEEIGIDFLNNK